MKSSSHCVAAIAAALVLSVFAHPGQTQDALCTDGYAPFDYKFATGVTVNVGPAKSGQFAQRTCSASLSWEKQQLVVATDAAQIDVDLLGADLGMNGPVVAFQVRKLDSDALTTYQVYSLERPPRLLRTISGAENFTTGDVELDGRVAIWADDTGVLDGIDGLPRNAFAAAPVMVLRFEEGKLVDAGSEFQTVFDPEILRLRSGLDPQAAAEFKKSDALPHQSAEDGASLRLLDVKANVLGLVWLFLYSGREPDAWATLADYWPPADVDRIRSVIRARIAKGLRSQVDGISTHVPAKSEIKKAPVFDQTNGVSRAMGGVEFERSGVDQIPKGIRLKRPEPENGAQAPRQARERLDLLVDSAGKVRAAAMAPGENDDALVDAARQWKFIPAFRGGRAVACRFRMFVEPYR